MPYQNKMTNMKKITTVIAASVLAMISATTFACPKGTTLTGGVGPHHQGGKCVTSTGAPAAKAVKKDANKAQATAVKAKDDSQKAKDSAAKDSAAKANTAAVQANDKAAKAKAAADAKAKAAADAKAKTASEAKAKAKADTKPAEKAAKTATKTQ